MSDIAYRLLVDMSTKGSLAPQLDKMQGQSKGLDTSLKGLGSTLTGSVGSVVGGLSTAFEQLGDKVVGISVAAAQLSAAGFAAAVGYGVSLNNQVEKTQVGLAAIFNATSVSPNMADGLEVATAAMEKMRIHARDLPGELKDLQLMFKLGLTPGLNIGANVGQLERMSANAMAAAATMELPMDQAARELAQLYGGRAGAHNVFGSMLGFTGDSAKKLNAATGEDRLKQIESALGKYKDSVPVFARTFEALTSTLKDTGDQTLRRATKPVFDSIKVQLDRANKWFGDNEDKVGHFADDVGRRLDHGFDVGRRKIEQWAPAILTFAHNAEERIGRIWEKASPFVKRLEGLTLGALQDPKTFDRLESLGKLYLAAKVGNVVAPAAMPLLSGLFDVGSASVGAGGVAGALGGIGLAAAVAIPALVLAASTFHVLTDASSDYHLEATRSAASLAKSAKTSFEATANVWDRVGSDVMKPLDFIASQYLGQFEFMASAAASTLHVLDLFTQKLEQIGVLNVKPLYEAPERDPTPFEYSPSVKAMGNIADALNLDNRKTKTGAGGGGGGTNIQKVEIVVSTNQDPNRVARLTVDRLLDVSRFPKSSSSVRNWSSERP